MGKIILCVAVLFFIYWGIKYKKSSEESDKPTLKDNDVPNNHGYTIDNIDRLEDYYKKKIKELEDKCELGVKYSQENLQMYKEELQKIKNIRNN